MSVLVFNGHTHPEDEVGIKIDNRLVEDSFRKPLTLVSRWTIVGALRSDGTSASLNTQVAALEAAYRDGGENYGDATFTANGNVHRLLNSTSFSGVQVAAFGWTSGPWKMSTEMTNRRAFFAVLQAEYRASGALAYPVAYKETVQRIGNGGNHFKYMPSLLGLPQKQVLRTYTTVRYVQSGMAVFLNDKPAAQTPLLDNIDTDWSYIHQDAIKVKEIAPTSITTKGSGNIEQMHGVEWQYVYTFPTAALPHELLPGVGYNAPTDSYYINFNTPTV